MDAATHEQIYSEISAELRDLELRRQELMAVQSYHGRKAGAINVRINDGLGNDQFAVLSQIQAGEVVLAENGKPLQTGEIVSQMIARGFKGDPKKLKTSIYTAMIRKEDTFRRVGKGTWGLVAWDKPKEETPSSDNGDPS